MKLAIVIPAYNEEQAIASIIKRTLEAKSHITEHSPVSDVEVIVVSDGSTDKTVEIARGYDGIRLIAFERNRGYGAAIKRGFEEVESDLVGFLDADGTCDPRFFADLCTGLCASDASVALGSRMGPGSQMPNTRRLGNKIYACILSVLTNQVVHDTASGMRVIRRSALERLYPLPDGLNFTPAMSARAMLDDKLPVLELPMSYKERVGESKLNVLHDGWRFFETIMEMTLFWRPARVFLSGAILCALVTVILAAHPIEMWLKLGHLEESMIYRLLFCSFLGSLSALFVSALIISESLHRFNHDASRKSTLIHRAIEAIFTTSGIAYVTAALGTLAGIIVGPGVWSWVTEGQVFIHWSRVVFSGLLAFIVCQLLVTKIIVGIIELHVSRSRFVEIRAKVQRGKAAATLPSKRRLPKTQPSVHSASGEAVLM